MLEGLRRFPATANELQDGVIQLLLLEGKSGSKQRSQLIQLSSIPKQKVDALSYLKSIGQVFENVAPDYINKRDDGDYYYLELATKTAAYEGDTPKVENGVLTYEFNVTLNFDWGDYFKYEAENTENHDRTPANYYNNVLTEDYNREDLAGKTAIEQNIKKEMDDMSKALTSSNDTNNGAKLHVICSVDVGDAAVSG